MTHCAAGRWISPPAQTPHAHPPYLWDGPCPTKGTGVAHINPHQGGCGEDEEGWGGEGAGTQGGQREGDTGTPRVQHQLPTPP